MKPVVLITESDGMSSQARHDLEQVGYVIAASIVDRSELLTAVKAAAVLWVRLRHRIDAEVIASAPNLAVIATPTTGLDHIDVNAADRANVEILSLRDAGSFLDDVRATSELTLGLMLSLLRRIPQATRDVTLGHWDRDAFKGLELCRRTVGIIGYGRLGRLVAGYLKAFGARVVACDPHVHSDDIEMMTLDEVLAISDVVSIHVKLSDETRGLIGHRELALLKPSAILINTSRGELIDEHALLDALTSRRIAGAALDVLAGESASGVGHLPLVSYAREHPELLITPHIGGCTFESMAMTEVFLARRVRDALMRGRQ